MLPSSNLEVIIWDNKAEDDTGRRERSAVGRGIIIIIIIIITTTTTITIKKN